MVQISGGSLSIRKHPTLNRFLVSALKRQDDWVSNVVFLASAAAIGPDGSGDVGGTAYTQGEGDSFISTVFHLDSDGSLIWKWTVSLCVRCGARCLRVTMTDLS